MTYTIDFLASMTGLARIGGLFLLVLVATGILISEAARSRLSPGKMIVVTGSAILAGVVLWVLPSLINYARYDVGTIIPEYPIGGYQ
ncbi:hypothetical protein [Nocardia brasiliensis]|uniref:hypothetical protein n=1 Tax=Nocardia brasiliensis TaxID=37326 RepID=UPI0024577EBF|nr:hypothetical protein [Nocardia brasiliensis]